MADKYLQKSGLEYLWSKLKTRLSLKADARYGIYPIVGTQTTDTADWTGVFPLNGLYAGTTIAYYLPTESEENATLQLTLSDGSTTAKVPIYINGITRLGREYPSGSTIILTYWPGETIKVDGQTITSPRWTCSDQKSIFEQRTYSRKVILKNHVDPIY